MSASTRGISGGQPSTTQPIAIPWLSPKVVTRNRWPKVLWDMVPGVRLLTFSVNVDCQRFVTRWGGLVKSPLISSWPGIAVRRTASLPLAYARPSTSCLAAHSKEGVDARDKPGHDGDWL